MTAKGIVKKSSCLSVAWVACFFAVYPASAGSLSVTAGAAQSGNQGLQVGVNSCQFAEELVLEPPGFSSLSGPFTACQEIFTQGLAITGNGATLTAGRSLTFGEGFQVQTGADLTATLDPTIDPWAFLFDDSPEGLVRYSASWEMDLTNLSLGPGDEIVILGGLAADGTPLFEVVAGDAGGMTGHRLILRALLDNDSVEELPIPERPLLLPGSNKLTIGWQATQGTGFLQASVNDAPFFGLDGLDNGDRRLESVRWGAVSGTAVTAGGDFALDEFVSFDWFDRPVQTVTSATSLTATPPPDNPAYLAFTGTQAGRLRRSGDASACGSPKMNPGELTSTGDRRYDEYRFVALQDGCVTVTLETPSDNKLFSVAYGEAGLNPSSTASNYLADPGTSPTSEDRSKSFSFDVTRGQIFHVVVHEVSPGGGVGESYVLTVDGVKLRPDFSLASTLDAVPPPENPAASVATEVQTGRLNRSPPGTSCDSIKPNPGLASTSGSRQVDVLTFEPLSSGCAVVGLTHAGTARLQAIVYDENGFDPADPSLNYLADLGFSANNRTRTFSFPVTAGIPFEVAISEVDPGASLGDDYILEISNVRLTPTVRIAERLDGVAPPPRPEFTFFTGSQTGRLNRFPPISACGSNKSNPGLFTSSGLRLYEAFTFVPTLSGCVEATLTGWENASLFSVAYDSRGFVPLDPDQHYLADPAESPKLNEPIRKFSFGVVAGVAFTLVVHERNPDGGVDDDFLLTVGGRALQVGPEPPLQADDLESGNLNGWTGQVSN